MILPRQFVRFAILDNSLDDSSLQIGVKWGWRRASLSAINHSLLVILRTADITVFQAGRRRFFTLQRKPVPTVLQHGLDMPVTGTAESLKTMNATAKRMLGIVGIVGIVAIAGLCYLWGHHAGRNNGIRQVKMAFKTGKEDLAWWTRWENENKRAGIMEWLTVTIHRGTNEPYWTIRDGKPLKRDEFERVIGKLRQFGITEIFIYGEDEVTVQQVEQTLDILHAHSVTNIVLFTRVQGVLDSPFYSRRFDEDQSRTQGRTINPIHR